ncbi:hypothetical protein KI387_017935, partial [Taxus chinensis]
EIGRGPDATAYSVGGMEGKSANLSAFGTLIVVDDAITEGPHPSSKLLGRLQGIEASSDMKFINYHMLSSIIFEDGSSLQIHGTIRTRLAKRELSIVGGDGRFKYARGYVVVEVQQFNGINLTFKLTVT